MKKSILISCFISLLYASFAQTSTNSIVVTVANEKKEKISQANASLFIQPGQKLVKTAMADAEGKIVFDKLIPGIYRVKVSAATYEENSPDSIEVNNSAQGIIKREIILRHKDNSNLAEVTVSAKKPFIQRLHDRIIVNVDNSIINAGSSAFEVLERSPGVTIDGNDNIALKGKQGVIIMIDGKPSPMTGQDLANYLRGLTSNNIDRLEIITNPSSKYDAAGNSGIIDIRLKKDQRLGTNGSFNAGYGQGVYPKANAGISLNYRNKKVNYFGSYNYGYRKNLNHLFLDRNFYKDGVFSGSDLKDNFSRAPFSNHSARAGADFFITKKSIIGFVLNTNFNHFTRQNDNSSIVMDDQSVPAFTFNTNAHNNDNNYNAVANINFKHTFDSTGREVTADADYGVYNTKSLSETTTQYYKIGGGSQQPDYILQGDQKGELIFKTAKVDYTHPFKKALTVETGLKTSFVSSDNDAIFYNASSGGQVNDASKTNHFLYDENNNAAYVSVKKNFKKWDMQLGLRAEQTNVKTYQAIGDVSWDSSYLQLFPTAFFNYKIKPEQTIGVSVSRRIDRPGYSQLNPFLFLIDVTTYATGNPGLLPQLTWAYELSYTLKNMHFSFSYSHTNNNQNIAIARFEDVFPNLPQADNVTVQIPVNISSSDYAGLSVSIPVKWNKWWSMSSNADLFYNHFNGSLGSTSLNKGKPAAQVRLNNSFTINKKWTAELNGNFSSGGQYGFMVANPQWALSAGFQRSILQNKGSIRFNVTDIFWTNLPKAVITYNDYIERWHAIRESRVATLSFNYRFGKKTVAAARRRTTASEEERQRAGN